MLENKKYGFQPRRTLGKTGFQATLLGIGDVADRQLSLADCATVVRRAMDVGLNVIDTAPGYEDGYSEEIVGEALRGRRNGMFVIDKIDHHDRPVTAQVEESLQRLKLDHTDAFVFHGVSQIESWKKIALPGGPLAELGRCVQAGKTRFRGISAHHPDVLQAAILSGLCDVVLFPIGPFCDRRYEEIILPLARAHGVGTVCFKTFGAGKLVGDTTGYNRPLQTRPRGKISSGGEGSQPILPHLKPADCVHYTLTCDPDVALLGLSFPNEQDEAFAAAKNFKPLTAERMAEIRREAAAAMAGKGPCWWNPTT
jgi:aryl-alcohol dehydrogenase-like predicted oxidoreductase